MEHIKLAIDIVGTLATIISVFWAIHSYKKANEDKVLLQIKENIMRIPEVCKEINFLLSEPFFAAIGNSIADELRTLYSADQELEEFSKFLLDDEKSQNYKALAIYTGLKKCSEVTQIKELVKNVQTAERLITVKCPYFGKSLSKLSFYITHAATKTVSAGMLHRSMRAKMRDGSDNALFHEAVKAAQKTGSPELFFKELALYVTSISRHSLKIEHHGQRTIDLSYTMLDKTSTVFALLSESEIKSIIRNDAKLKKKNYSVNNKHAVEDAMEILKKYKKYFDEEKWEKLVECKGRIIELMDSHMRDDDDD